MEQNQLIALVERTKKGDAQAFEGLFAEFKDVAYGTAMMLLHNEQDAQDAVQDTAVLVFRKLHLLGDPRRFFGWVKRITINVCRSKLRKHTELLFAQQEEEDMPFDLMDEAPRPDEAVDTAETRRIVVGMIEALPADQRVCVQLFYGQQLTVEEIAKLLEVSTNTVKSRLFYARKKIGAQAEEYRREGTPLYALVPAWMLRAALQDQLRSLRMMPQAAQSILEKTVSVCGMRAAAETAATALQTAESAASASADAASAAANAAVSATTQATTAAATATAASAAAAAAVEISPFMLAVSGFFAKIAALPIAAKIVGGITAVGILLGGGAAAAGVFEPATPEKLILGEWASYHETSTGTQVDGAYQTEHKAAVYQKIDFEEDGSYSYIYLLMNEDETLGAQYTGEGSWSIADRTLQLTEHSGGTEIGTEGYFKIWEEDLLRGSATIETLDKMQLVLQKVSDEEYAPRWTLTSSGVTLPEFDENGVRIEGTGHEWFDLSDAVVVEDDEEEYEETPEEVFARFSKLSEDIEYGTLIQLPESYREYWMNHYAGYWNSTDTTGSTANWFIAIEQTENGWEYVSGLYDSDMFGSAVITDFGISKTESGEPAFCMHMTCPAVEESEFRSAQPERTATAYYKLEAPNDSGIMNVFVVDGEAAFAYAGETLEEAYANR